MAELAKTHKTDAQSQNALELINDKWAVAVLQSLKEGGKHYGELQRDIDGITKKMLTQTLRNLERNGIITRETYNEGKITRSLYEATTLGNSLMLMLSDICMWSLENRGDIAPPRYHWTVFMNEK